MLQENRVLREKITVIDGEPTLRRVTQLQLHPLWTDEPELISCYQMGAQSIMYLELMQQDHEPSLPRSSSLMINYIITKVISPSILTSQGNT